MKPISIVGACYLTVRDVPLQRLEEYIFQVARGALDSAGLDRDDLDAVVLSASDHLDGRSISSMLTAAPAGGLLKDTVKVTDSGLHALAVAAMRILSGDTDLAMVVSWGFASQAKPDTVQWTSLEPFVERPGGVIDLVAAGLMANAYVTEFNRGTDELDERSRQKWAASFPNQVLPAAANDTAMIAYPLRRQHVAPTVDAAAAVIVASPGAAARRGLKSMGSIAGFGWATDAHGFGEREVASWPVLRRATATALSRGGLALEDLDSVEIEDRTVVHELLAVEGLGLAAPGEGFDYLSMQSYGHVAPQVNKFTEDGFAGLPLQCLGLWRLAKLCTGNQPARVALQNSTGLGGQGHIVVVAEAGDVV